MAAFVPAVGAQPQLLGQFDDVGSGIVTLVLAGVVVHVFLTALAVMLGMLWRDAIRGTGRAVTRAVQREPASADAQRDPARASSASASPSPAAPDAPQGAAADAPPGTAYNLTSGNDAAEVAAAASRPILDLGFRPRSGTDAAELARRAVEAVTVADSNGQVWEADLRDAALRWAEAEGLADGDRSLLTRAWLASAARSSGAVRTDAWHARRGRRYDGLRLRKGYGDGD